MLNRKPETQTIKRPVAVTIIAWLNLIGGVITLILTPSFNSPEVSGSLQHILPLSALIVFSGLAGVISAASGMAMLAGRAWGRSLYLLFWPVSALFSLVAYRLDMSFMLAGVIGTLFYIVELILLTRPNASAFFSGKALEPRVVPSPPAPEAATPAPIATPVSQPQASASLPRKVIAVTSLVGGGLLLFTSVTWLIFGPLDSARGFWDIVEGFLFFLMCAVGFIAAGTSLWGWDRWRILGGVVSTVSGAVLVVYAFAFLTAMLDPQVVASLGIGLAPSQYASASQRFALFGVSLMGKGIVLIIWQKRNDKVRKSRVAASLPEAPSAPAPKEPPAP